MPTLPSLSGAFSSLASGFNSVRSSMPTLSPTAYNGVFAPPKSAVSPMSTFAPKAPAVPNMSVAPTNMSVAPTAKPTAPFSAPAAPTIPKTTGLTTMPTAPVTTPTSPYVTTPSGATVDPATGALIQGPGNNASPVSNPAIPDTSGIQSSPQNAPDAAATFSNYGSYGGATPLPALPNGSINYDPLITSPEYEGALSNYEKAAVPTQQELDAMTNLNNLNTSAATAYTNTENQPIALPFITGQQAAQQRSQQLLATPLQSQITLLQAQRQAASTAAQTALGVASDKLAATRDLAKPISTAYGGTASRYNPQTHQYETIVNPFGSASDTAAGGGSASSTQDILGQLTAAGITPTRYSLPGYLSAVKAGVPIQDIINNKAAITFLNSTDTQKFIANSNTALNTINDPTQGIKALSDKVNRGNIQILNNGQFALKTGVSDLDTANFVQQANILADEVSKLLGSGQGSDFAIQLGQTLVNPNYSQDTFNATMDNLAGRVQNKVNEYVKQGTVTSSGGAFSNGSGSSSNSSSGSGSIYDF